MVNFLLQENIDDLQKLSDRLLHISDENGYIYADDLSELHQAIHEKIIDLYSQRGKTPEQDATLCLAILMGYNVSMYANPEDEERKQAVLTRSLSLLDVLPLLFLSNSYLPFVTRCRSCAKSTETFLFVNENAKTF